MKKQLREELKKKIYTIMITYPTRSDYEIGRVLHIPRSTVWTFRKSLISAIDYQLARNVAGKFLTEFQMATDYFKLQIERLENLKEKKKTIFKKGDEGQSYAEEISLEPLDILQIEKQQTELWKNILFLARQGEAVEVMRLIQNGRIKQLTN